MIKTRIVLFFSYMTIDNFDFILMMILLFGNAFVLYIFHIKNNFMNYKMRKLLSMLSAINLWSSFLLCFSKFMEPSSF